ncbi:AAA domain-containing protein [Ruaniaceae bacterium KH17]|nr:AAA domain-containing protein [Ruaniaceae bacterium KH17]
MASWEDRVVTEADRILSQSSPSIQEMKLTLAERGLRLDEGRLWEILTSRGVAEVVGERYVRRGTVEEKPTGGYAGGHIATADNSGVADESSELAEREPSQIVAHELRQLRRNLDIDPLPGEHTVEEVSARWRERAGELARAVDEELRTSSSKVALHDVPITDGRPVAATKTRVLWQFDVQGELPGGEGSAVTFIPESGTHAKATYEAEIVSVFGNDVTIALPHECVNTTSGKLRCDLTWLLIKQKQRLLATASGAPGFSGNSALKLTEPCTRSFSSSPLFSSVEPESFLSPLPRHELNEQQANAVEMARKPQLTWLWGPPGTGKTTTVAAIVDALAVHDGKRVLVVAPTNVAVDVALKSSLDRIGLQEPGFVVRVGAAVDADLINRTKGRVLVDEVAADRGSDVAARRVKTGATIAELRRELSELQRGRSMNMAERFKLETKLVDQRDLASGLDELMVDLRRQVCRDARVVFATTSQVLLRSLEGLPFDVVIIDEGSMVPTTMAALVAGSSNGHVIVTGDFRQLPPVATGDAAPVLHWLRRSPFESCQIDLSVQTASTVPGLAVLVEQHRMHEKISDAVSASFYPESPLRTSEWILDRHLEDVPLGWSDDPLILIDTSRLNTRVSRRHGQSSRLNVAHAQIAAGINDLLGRDHFELGFISPFAPQAKLLGSFASDSVRASTVHRYQGSESDIVIFDAVDATQYSGRLHPWFAEGELGSEGARLVNVAASRAREQLVLLADMSRIHQGRENSGAVARFLRQMKAQATDLPWQAAIRGTVTRTCSDPVPVIADALNASESAEMFFPDASPEAVRRLLALIDRGRLDDVTVWVSPDETGAVVASMFDKAGALPRALKPLRESLVVTDDTVITASGALLCEAPSGVLMTKHRELAESVRRVVRRRDSGQAPGSGKHGESCGRCGRPLVRTESTRFGVGYECIKCESPRGTRRRA